MITHFKKFTMNESLSNFDLTKIVSITHIDKDETGWIYTIADGRKLFLPKEHAESITLIDDRLMNFVNSGRPINKYLEADENNHIIYSANFAADSIPFRKGQVYLIERKDGRGWAIPGGFIDVGETPEQAASRELMEETLVKPKHFTLEKLCDVYRTTDPREINFFTYPFIAHMTKDAEMQYGDDAINGKWVSLERAIKMPLAFQHHNELLKKISY